jgi:hypothetical protein
MSLKQHDQLAGEEKTAAYKFQQRQHGDEPVMICC